MFHDLLMFFLLPSVNLSVCLIVVIGLLNFFMTSDDIHRRAWSRPDLIRSGVVYFCLCSALLWLYTNVSIWGLLGAALNTGLYISDFKQWLPRWCIHLLMIGIQIGVALAYIHLGGVSVL